MHYYPVKRAAARAESTSAVESSPQEESRPSSRNIRRKVMRKRNGESRVFDESFASTDSGELDFIHWNLSLGHLYSGDTNLDRERSSLPQSLHSQIEYTLLS